MNPLMSCTYDRISHMLKITNPVDPALPAENKLLSFVVTNFKNPYNGKVSTGYYI